MNTYIFFVVFRDKKNANDDNYYEEFLRELNSWTRDLNFKLPPPHHLKYRYPAPNPEVLYNISNMLLSVPKFYTQVVHGRYSMFY